MVKQYPDVITVTLEDDYRQNMETGNFRKLKKNSSITFDCRAEAWQPTEKGNADGVIADANFRIYAAPIGVEIPIGSPYSLNRRGITFTGNVKAFFPNQFNCTLWG